MKIKCTECQKEFEIDIDGKFDIENVEIQDELSRQGHLFGINREQNDYVLCEDCTNKVAYE